MEKKTLDNLKAENKKLKAENKKLLMSLTNCQDERDKLSEGLSKELEGRK